jgi:hypothetical protein
MGDKSGGTVVLRTCAVPNPQGHLYDRSLAPIHPRWFPAVRMEAAAGISVAYDVDAVCIVPV